MAYTQNNTLTRQTTTPRSLEDLFQSLDREEKSILKQRACIILEIKDGAFYKILRGDSEISAKGAILFGKYFNVDPITLIDSSDREKIEQVTRFREDPQQYGKIVGSFAHMVLTKSSKAE